MSNQNPATADLPSSNPYEMFGPDTLGNLARRLALSKADPKNAAKFVTDKEVARVARLHPREAWPSIIVERMLASLAGEVRAPRGRKRHGGLDALKQQWAIACYEGAMEKLKGATPHRLATWCEDNGLKVEPLTRANAAAELTRVMHLPHMSWGSIRTLISKQRSDFLRTTARQS